ncbi:MAG TPA: patatin-like phospholipase family protein [Vicinamibacterales bacterium]|nr:patatin-like phospholipase family protein [Vicinamibacterales bacterium]
MSSRTPPPRVGVAFGGGSARGIAHVGVIRWLEEHRIPIDVAAGTSMGGLVGGAFATGMDAAELQAFITSVDWDELFGDASFEFKNIRRKADARAYPSRLEFGLKGGGIVPPAALNNGQAIELMLARICAPYFGIEDFDELPTPFRTVAVDLLTAEAVVMRSGSLADAMRATMSLPLAFPPIDLDGRMLVDGGAMNNVPADVVKAMGAERVVAVNVGDLSTREGISATLLGLVSETTDAMMRASTRRALTSADVVVNVPLKEYGSLDWRRASSLIDEGYRAADAMRDQLLPFAVSEADFETWRTARRARRRTELPVPTFVQLDGFGASDAGRLDVLLARHVGTPVDVAGIEQDIATMAGLDRYQSVTWQLRDDSSRGVGLRVQGRVKPYGPPFLMLGLSLDNTTSSDFRISASARYLAFDTVGSGSELRLNAAIGSDASVAAELYRPLGSTPLFVAPYAGVATTTLNLIDGDAIVARYRQTIPRMGVNVGVDIGSESDLRLGAYLGHRSTSVETGDPGLPELAGSESGAELLWRVDTQDSPVVAGHGVHSQIRLTHVFDGPDLLGDVPFASDTSLTQLSGSANQMWSLGPRNRLFVYGSLGTSFEAEPLLPDQFALGAPFRLGAYDTGEISGAHAYAASGGYLRQIGRLPDFLGGPVFAGAWLENGDAFDNWRDATWRSNGGAGVVMDTIIGPMILAGSWSFDGRWRTYLNVGRLFR